MYLLTYLYFVIGICAVIKESQRIIRNGLMNLIWYKHVFIQGRNRNIQDHSIFQKTREVQCHIIIPLQHFCYILTKLHTYIKFIPRFLRCSNLYGNSIPRGLTRSLNTARRAMLRTSHRYITISCLCCLDSRYPCYIQSIQYVCKYTGMRIWWWVQLAKMIHSLVSFHC